jgi:hypothetical protein
MMNQGMCLFAEQVLTTSASFHVLVFMNSCVVWLQCSWLSVGYGWHHAAGCELEGNLLHQAAANVFEA